MPANELILNENVLKIRFNVCLAKKGNKPRLLIYRNLESKSQIDTLLGMLLSDKKILAQIQFSDELKALSRIKEFQKKI